MSKHMSKHIRFTRLIERTNDDGELVLSGWFGNAKVIGHRGQPSHTDGSATWNIYLAEPDERAIESKRAGQRARRQRQEADHAEV